MRVLVTGCAGFIAGHVIDQLAERGDTVLGLDHLDRGDKEHWGPLGHDYMLGDVRDSVAVSEAVARVDAVMHLAGVLGTAETVNDPRPAIETNIMGGLNVFQAMRAHGKAGVYIAVGNHWMNNSYSITKTTAERFALMFNREHETRIAVVRALNAYGPRQKPSPVRKIIPNFVLPALRREPITIYGNGEQIMDMIFVEDVAHVLIRAMDYAHQGGRDGCPDVDLAEHIFEAGTGRRTTVNEIADDVLETVFGEDDYDPAVAVKHVEMRAGETPQAVVLGDPQTLAPLGLEGRDLMSLDLGLKATVDYYRKMIDMGAVIR